MPESGTTITQDSGGRAAGRDYIEKQNNQFILNINPVIVHKLFLFFFVHIGLTSILFFVQHSITNTPLSLYNYFDLFFKLILFGYIPLMFIVGLILFIILILFKVFKFIFKLS